jgi:hypothetical protein
MSKTPYLIRDSSGMLIGQYYRQEPPKEPDNWDGGWNVEEASISELNSEPVE